MCCSLSGPGITNEASFRVLGGLITVSPQLERVLVLEYKHDSQKWKKTTVLRRTAAAHSNRAPVPWP